MATENPKVSGYVSQEVFDSLMRFKDEQGLKSVSQALTFILTEYLQVDQKVDRQSNLLLDGKFATLEQFKDLEQKVSELLSKPFSEPEQEIDNKLSELLSKLKSESAKIIEIKISELRGELLSGLTKQIEVRATDVLVNQVVVADSEPLSESQSRPKNDPSLQLGFIEETLTGDGKELELPTEPSAILPSNSFSHLPILPVKLLAKRLRVTDSVISNHKREKTEKDFYEWLKKKDPDGISWEPVGGSLTGYSKGWVPASDTPSELLSGLLDWIASEKSRPNPTNDSVKGAK